jgi:hypothetical protein
MLRGEHYVKANVYIVPMCVCIFHLQRYHMYLGEVWKFESTLSDSRKDILTSASYEIETDKL